MKLRNKNVEIIIFDRLYQKLWEKTLINPSHHRYLLCHCIYMYRRICIAHTPQYGTGIFWSGLNYRVSYEYSVLVLDNM